MRINFKGLATKANLQGWNELIVTINFQSKITHNLKSLNPPLNGSNSVPSRSL